jgi:hypothetical protein
VPVNEPPTGRLLQGLLLAAILAVGAWLHWTQAGVLQIESDDLVLMGGSQRIHFQGWRHVFEPQHIHLIPLYKLLRLPFDLHFPEWWFGFHALLVGVHLASACALYLISRQYLANPWAAVATLLAFAWAAIGDEALVWKAAAPFALSWMCALWGFWRLTRPRLGSGVIGAGLLLAAVGFFSGMVFVIPGVLASVALLEPGRKRRAMVVCLGTLAVGSLTWALLNREDLAHYWRYGGGQFGVAARLAGATMDSVRAYNYPFWGALRVFPSAPPFLALAAPVLALILLRRELHWRWIASGLAMTLPLLFVIVLIRADPGVWKISRYAYQSFTLWVFVAGAVVDALLRRLQSRPRRRAALLASLPLVAGLYLAGQVVIVRHHRDSLLARPEFTPTFWFGWDGFFRLASAHRTELGRPLEMPYLELAPGRNTHTVLALCHPEGLPGLRVNHHAAPSHEQLEAFWAEVDYARERLAVFRHVTLPARGGGEHRH